MYLTSLISTFLIVGCGTQSDEKASKEAKFVKIYKVENQEKNTMLSFNGVVKEKSLTSLSFRVGGPLNHLKVNTGDNVKKGQLIASIDQRDYELQVHSTEVQYKQLSSEYKRYKVLDERNTVPQNTFEKIESNYLLAKTSYENTKNQLKDTELIAPVSGYIHEKFVENFQTIEPGQPIISIIDLSQTEIVVSIPESQLLKLNSTNDSYVKIENAAIKMQEVKLLSRAEKTSEDGLYEVKFVMQNTAGFKVLPGMSAVVRVYCKNVNQTTLSIPNTSIFNREDKSYVWIYNQESKSITKREIKIKKMLTNGMIEIRKGLKSSDLIISAGIHSLSENQKVKPLNKISKSNVGGLL